MKTLQPLECNLPEPGPGSVGWTRAETARLATAESPFELELGGAIGPVDIEYETYGTLAPDKGNVILIVHALSGDAHVAGYDADAAATGRTWRQKRPGWWDDIVGPGKAVDTDRWFVVCANVLGSCCGTTGPGSINPATGAPYGLGFPMVTVGDWVRLQARLLDELGIEGLYAVVGGSLGGQQAIEWALAYPDRVQRCIVIAASPKLSTQGLAFNAVGRHCILSDPHFRDGDYYAGEPPAAGLAAARMLAHITYLSDDGMSEKFGRRRRDCEAIRCGFGVEYEVESYLEHQGRSFVKRFDANSYLYITRAMDYYDAAAQWGGGDLVRACARIRARVMVVSFDSDWLYPPSSCREFVRALTLNNRPATYVQVPSRYGHDAFLVETEQTDFLVRNFLSPDQGRTVPEAPWSCAASTRRWQDRIIENEIGRGASVLDLGCGSGELLTRLVANKEIRGQGVELDPGRVFDSVRRGAPVIQDDLDAGLGGFPDQSFDFVVLEETLQTVGKPARLLEEMLRIGRCGVVSFPNFANRQAVYDLIERGRMPVRDWLPYQWYDTPNIHLFTLRDFLDWAQSNNVQVIKGFVRTGSRVRWMGPDDDLEAEEALLLVKKAGPAPEYHI